MAIGDDYNPLYTPGEGVPTRTSAAVQGGQLVGVSGDGTCAPTAGATAAWLGIAAHNVPSGGRVTVFSGGVQRPVASGAITAGQPVEAAAGGKVAAHTLGTNDGNIIGTAKTTAADGVVVEVAFIR